MTNTTKELEQYRELEENQEFHEKRKLVRQHIDEVRDFSDDLEPEDMATIAYLMNAQTNHESTHRGSMSLVYKTEVLEYDSGGKRITVNAVQMNGSPKIEKPEADGQFGEWSIETLRSRGERAGEYAGANMKFGQDIQLNLCIVSPERFLLNEGEELEEEEE